MTVRVTIDSRRLLRGVRDQKIMQTCLSHAVSSSHEQLRNHPRRLSAEFLHFHATKGAMKAGATVSAVRTALEKHGQADESVCPPPDDAWQPPSGAQTYRRRSDGAKLDVETIRDILIRGGFPVVVIRVPTSFVKVKAPWVLHSPGLDHRGNHAVVAVGWREVNGVPAVLVRNSWGKKWGEEGHVWLCEPFFAHHAIQIFELTGDES